MNGAATRRGPNGLGFGPAMRMPLGTGPNAAAPNGAGLGPGAGPGPGPAGPNGKTLVEGYRKDIISGFEKDKPRYNPLNPERPQSSALVDLKDPVQVHLLTETALSDSRGFEILSQEEVDDLKKQIQSLTMRIEQAQTNLAIQSKYRDAAISMAKLYSPSRPEGKRLSLRGNRMSDSAKEAEMEKQASERRCEELATELFTLEKRLMEPQRRLLQHTAGILQMTHRASVKRSAQPPTAGQPMPNGIPGSPESLYTYTNARNSMEAPNDEGDFDDRSLYLPLEQMEGQPRQPARTRKNTIEIPQKSPIREQTNQLREEMERVKEENARLKAAEEKLNSETETLQTQTEALRTQSMGQIRTISDTEKKLQSLNGKLREVIIRFGPARSIDFGDPDNATGSGDTLRSQLAYLERGLEAAAEEQESFAAGMSRDIEMNASAAVAAETALSQAEGRVEGLITQLQDLLQQSSTSKQLPPEPVNATLNDQLVYLEDALQTVGDELLRVTNLSSSATASSNRQNDSNEADTAVLTGLWNTIQTGLIAAQQQKAARKKARIDKGLEPDEEDMSGDEVVDEGEAYSLPAFESRVKWLFAQATRLREQKAVLKRQIKQQRELNNKSGSEKDQELQAKDEELERVREKIEATEEEATETREKLAQALGDMERLRKSTAAVDVGAQDRLKEREASFAALEASYEEVESSYQEAQAQLAQAEAVAAELRNKVEEKEREATEREEELDRMNTMVVELKTEVAIAKAELDGAYGSRKQRAAEAAALAQSSELDELNGQVARLKTELASTLRDFEDMTRDSIAAEKEKLDLEGRLDDAIAARASFEAEARAARDKLEAEVGRLQELLDAEKLKVPPSPAPGGGPGGAAPRAGASMLSEQFRATMKEERKKFQEELREEQAKRRKLEDEMRVLRRGQPQAGPGRSPLGPLSPR